MLQQRHGRGSLDDDLASEGLIGPAQQNDQTAPWQPHASDLEPIALELRGVSGVRRELPQDLQLRHAQLRQATTAQHHAAARVDEARVEPVLVRLRAPRED